MTATTGTCDACGREGPVQQLETVLLPNGDLVTCCPECRYHAEQLAADATLECDGCATEVTATELERTELPDGTELDLCPECRADLESTEPEEPGASAAAEATASDSATTTGASSSTAADAAAASEAAKAAQQTAAKAAAAASSEAGGSVAGGSTSDAGHSPDDGSTTSQETEARADGADARHRRSYDGPMGEPATSAEDADDATDRPARTKQACDQCGGLFSIELFQVTTVDGRTEQFCPDCKDEGIDSGLVTDVELRRAQAYEVLSIEEDAAPSAIREAYLEKVKEVHPDRSEGSRTEFMLVQEAYDRLSGE